MTTTPGGRLQPSDAELLAAFEPHVLQRFEPADSEWKRIVAEEKRNQRSKRIRRLLLGWLQRFRRTQRGIRSSYSLQWKTMPLEEQLTAGAAAPYVFRHHSFIGSTQGEKRVHHALLAHSIEQLAPTKVLEVGAGNGLNLLALAGRFPGIRLTGLELTQGGVRAAARVRAMPELPRQIVDFNVRPPNDLSAHCRINFVQGSAAELPFPDGSFDLVFTVLALEQMEEIRDRALAELRRVSSRYVLMLEPFRDWNKSGIRRDYIVANDYFAAFVSDLAAHNMRPVYADEIPAKLARGAGIVLAEVV